MARPINRHKTPEFSKLATAYKEAAELITIESTIHDDYPTKRWAANYHAFLQEDGGVSIDALVEKKPVTADFIALYASHHGRLIPQWRTQQPGLPLKAMQTLAGEPLQFLVNTLLENYKDNATWERAFHATTNELKVSEQAERIFAKVTHDILFDPENDLSIPSPDTLVKFRKLLERARREEPEHPYATLLWVITGLVVAHQTLGNTALFAMHDGHMAGGPHGWLMLALFGLAGLTVLKTRQGIKALRRAEPGTQKSDSRQS